MNARYGSALLDIALGTYAAAAAHRVVWHELAAFNTPRSPLSATEVAAYAACGLLLGALSAAGRLSPARILTGQGHTISHHAGRELSQHLLWLVATITIATGWIVTKISAVDFFSPQGLAAAGNIFKALFSPEFAIAGEALSAIVETIFLALMATLFALPFSFALSFFTARTLMKGSRLTFAVYSVLRVAVNFTRSVEPLVWAIIFSVWVGIGPFAGMLALTVATVSSLTKLYSEQIESIDQGPFEAMLATGASPLQVIWFAVVPQIVLPFLSYTMYRWDINVRMATVIGMVGGGGIGTLLIQYQGLARWNEVGLIVLFIAVVVWLMDYLSARIREAIA